MTSTEVGTAYVAIIPSARGFAKQLQKDIAKEFKGSKLDKLISDALGDTRVVVPVRTEVDTSDIPDQVRGREPKLPVRLDPLTRALQADVRRSLTALSREVSADIPVTAETDQLRTEISAAVTAVEQQLQADIPTEPAGRREYERQLRDAVDDVSRRVHATIHADVDVDQPSLDRATKKIDVESSGRRIGDRLGDSASPSLVSRIGQGITGVLPTSPLVLAAGAALGTALAAPAAAALTGGLLGGAGLGVLGLGAMLVKEQPEVAIAARQLVLTATRVFQTAAMPLVEPVADALDTIRHATVAWSSQFREIFELAAPAIQPLTEGLVGLISNALPGFTELIREATPFLINLGEQLPRLGEFLNQFFRIIDGGGPEASMFFNDLITVLGIVILSLGTLIRVATELYPVFRTIVAISPIGALIDIASSADDVRDSFGSLASGAQGAWNHLVALIRGAWRAVRLDTDGAILYFAGIPGRILLSFGNPGKWLYNVGRSLIFGLIDGIRSAFGALQDVLGWVTSKIPDWKGPADRDAVLLQPAGRSIMQGLIGGIHGERTALAAELAGVTSDIAVGGAMSASTYRAPIAPAPAPMLLQWRPGATGDPLLDALRELIATGYGGNPDAALGSS